MTGLWELFSGGKKKDDETSASLEALETRLKAVLPKQYQDVEIEPVSMGSAPLKYGRDGKVAWDEIWGSFCNLAMAGGPPHKGILLEPGTPEEIEADPQRYREVTDEICRGIYLVADLPEMPSAAVGWVRVTCASKTMADWLVRAIMIENISVRSQGQFLYLPAGPAYRVAKEIKNVVTAFAKTTHYWVEHMSPDQHEAIGNLFSRMEATMPLLEAPVRGYGYSPDAHSVASRAIASEVAGATGLGPTAHDYAGWQGFDCTNVRAAVWIMRALVASNVLSRREGTTVFVPVNPASDPVGNRAAHGLIAVHGFAVKRRLL